MIIQKEGFDGTLLVRVLVPKTTIIKFRDGFEKEREYKEVENH